MAYSDTVPASEFKQSVASGQREFKQSVASGQREFKQSVASGQREFKQSVASGQRQAKLMIKIILAVACFGLVLASLGKFTGIGAERVVNGAVVANYPVTMMVEADDAVALRSVETGQIVVAFDKGHGGFLRSAIRAFGLKRNQMKIAPASPFMVTRWESGRVTLNDPSTGHQVPVDSFGPMVTKMFAPLVADKTKN
jgi:putative photosynthetic complex assembly protein